MKNNSPLGRWKTAAFAAAAVVLFGSLGYLAGNRLNQPRPSSPEAGAQADSESLGLAGPASQAFPAKSTGGNSPAASKSRGPSVAVLTPKGSPTGEPLPPTGMNPDADKGRVVKLDASKLKGWANLKQGDQIALPTAAGDTLEGTVNLVQQDGTWLRMGGLLADGKGSFSLNTNFDQVSGMLLLPQDGIGYQIQMDGLELVLIERRLSSLVCFPSATAPGAMAASDSVARNAVATAVVVPIINTRPGARGVIYVDFDGETVTDPVWNGGRTINAAPSLLTSDQITLILNNASQDWAPFDVTFTTNAALYAAASPGSRMHVVVTPTDTAASGSGGVAYVDSWSGAGRGFRSDVVCWVFNQSVKTVTEALSHEVGHTVGLNHDGQTGGEYYSGHGGGLTTATSWAPIMGVGYSRSLVQWSKGEYAKANNTEDDLAIISKAANQFGFIKNELLNGERPLPVGASGNTFEGTGLLRTAASIDTYKFKTAGGQLLASVRAAAKDSDVDVQLELQNSTGGTVVLSDLSDSLSASLNKAITAGDYSLIVRPAGMGTKPAGGFTTSGYSAYGSLGKYVLSGSLQSIISLPVFSSATTVLGATGMPLTYTVSVSAGSTVTVAASTRLPAGLSFNPQTLVLSGTPTQESGAGTPGAADGPGLLQLVATNGSGSTTADIVITIAKSGLPLTDALLGNTATTTPGAPWVGVSLLKADGSTGTVAQSGAIANGGATTLRFDYVPKNGATRATAPWTLLTFYWKASTEALGSTLLKGDAVQCRVDGALQRDRDLGTIVYLSGETGWVKQTIRLNGGTTRRVEFIYAKDASLSAGQDRVWLYLDSLGQPPVVTVAPSSVRLAKDATTFTLSAEITGADSLVWKKDFATLSNGTSSSGSTFTGATTGTLVLSNISGADVGDYWLEGRNAYGAVTTKPVEVVLSTPPVITQQPAAPVGLLVGDPLTLTATVSGGTPIYYQWIKDGMSTRWNVAHSSTISFTVLKTTAASAGKYKLLVLNQFATVTSEPVTVSFSNAAPTNRPKAK
jgi:Metallo-peptidase family M12B Reprolysin-like/Putative Ig domain